MSEHILTGFGFGPIQAGLFVAEAFASGNFSRIVIAEIDQELVDALRASGGSYYVNVAGSESIEVQKTEDIEIYNPNIEEDREKILEALSQSTEIVTSLPSIKFFDMGENSIASLIAQGLDSSVAGATVIYAAENNNHAAEILQEAVAAKLNNQIPKQAEFLNTVIGKMSQVSNNKQEIEDNNLKTIATGIDRAFVVEEFNKILVTKCDITDFSPGIKVFVEKEDLLPFEEAKLYGHNAIHALLAYLGAYKGYEKMAELKSDEELMRIARDAFINESGGALVKKYKNLNDELFTAAGYEEYAEDLLVRMVNPYLDDTIERAARDPQRKLGLNDRIFGTMRLALEQGVEPVNMAMGAAAGINYLFENNLPDNVEDIFSEIWPRYEKKDVAKLIEITRKALQKL